MSKTLSLLVLCLGLLLVVAGCDRNVDVTQSEYSFPLSASITLPAGATLESATLNVYIPYESGHPVNVHRVTAAWDEMTVTWNSFGGAYDPAVLETLILDSFGWNDVDVTALVQGWIDGDFENYGLLLDQDEIVFPRNKFHSRDNDDYHPYIQICYTLNDQTICANEVTAGDTHIWEQAPNWNFGSDIWFYTGWYNDVDKEKQALLIFDTEPRRQEGCSHTIGYWKTHAGFGPQDDVVTPLLSIWLGDAGGAKSIEVTDAAMVVALMEKEDFGGSKNGIAKLYAQLLGSKLNIADGASADDISDLIADADAFLADNDWTDWDSMTKKEQKVILGWASDFDDYNNGFIGPGHCDDGFEIE